MKQTIICNIALNSDSEDDRPLKMQACFFPYLFFSMNRVRIQKWLVFILLFNIRFLRSNNQELEKVLGFKGKKLCKFHHIERDLFTSQVQDSESCLY